MIAEAQLHCHGRTGKIRPGREVQYRLVCFFAARRSSWHGKARSLRGDRVDERRRKASWKKLLGKHAYGFLSWVEENGIRSQAFLKLAADLEGYLLQSILVTREACEIFVSQLPAVLERCDEDIYNEPLVPQAYAHVHLLERYRRFWDILVELTKARVLPMRRDGIDVLDVGTGPAPALYAVADFYDAMGKYADAQAIPNLMTPPPSLESVESSVAMIDLVHTLSELGRPRGPFRATFVDFRGLNLCREQAQARERWTSQVADEMDTSEEFARW